MIEILYATPDNYKDIVAVSDSMFGHNYLSLDHLVSNDLEIFIVARHAGKMVGFGSCVVREGKGYINDIAVIQSAQRNGIGSMLVGGCLNYLWSLGVRKVETHAWEYVNDLSVPIDGPLRRNGFTREKYCKNFYYSEDSEYECTVCGTPCRCSSYLYSIILDDVTPPGIEYEAGPIY